MTKAVSINNKPTVNVDDATAIRIDLTNSSINANSTIQGQPEFKPILTSSQGGTHSAASETNGDQRVRAKTSYNGFDRVNSQGSAHGLNQIEAWLGYYNDGQLKKEYVEVYDDEHPSVIYYQFPDLFSGVCLKLMLFYTTKNNVKVLEAATARMASWTFETQVNGSHTFSIGTVTSPSANSSAGTQVAAITATSTKRGITTIELAGTNASLYRIKNTTDGTSGSTQTFTGNESDTFIIETASPFSGTYSHSFSVRLENNAFGLLAVENVATSGTAQQQGGSSSFQNTKAVQCSSSTSNFNIASHNSGTRDFELVGNKSLFPSLGNDAFPNQTGEPWAISFWMYHPSAMTGTDFDCIVGMNKYSTVAYTSENFRIFTKYYNNATHLCFGDTSSNNGNSYAGRDFSFNYNSFIGDWHHIIVTKDTNAPSTSSLKFYVDGVSQTFSQTYTFGTMASNCHDSVNSSETYLFSTLHTFNTNVNKYFADKTGKQIKIDELATFSAYMDTSDSSLGNMVSTLYNSGSVHNLSLLASGFNLERYFRLGDDSNDVNTGTLRYYDVENTSDYFEMNLSSDQSTITLTSSDTPYST